jgi:phosphatidylinositol alpha 1,6-mannosyltransferase
MPAAASAASIAASTAASTWGSYARAYRLGRAGEAFAWRWLRGIHNGAARTLAPSTVTATGLLGRGIGGVWLWGRGWTRPASIRPGEARGSGPSWRRAAS